jgi:hypothetical protein
MNSVIGDITKTSILKSESGKLTQEFPIQKTKVTIVSSVALVAADVVTVIVDGKSTAAIPFTTDANTTYALILAAIIALPTVASATWNLGLLTFTIVPYNQVNPGVFSTITHGGGTAVLTTTLALSTLLKGQLVKLDVDGTIIPLAAGDSFIKIIGVAMQYGIGGDIISVILPGAAIVMAKAGIVSLLPGPIAYAGIDAASGKMLVTSTTVTANTNFIGWSIDAGVAVGDDVRIVLAA